ncbi:MAG: galactokinase [Anaerolineae bacterium]
MHDSQRWAAARNAFVAAFGTEPAAGFRSPGRVNLIGEHTDYNEGFVLPIALDRDIWLLVRPRDDALIRLHNVNPEFAPCEFAISQRIPPGPPGDWSNYVRGAAQRLAQAFGPLKGMDALAAGEGPTALPRGAGVSSSSALTVVVAIALAALNRLSVPPKEMAQLTAEAEWYIGTRGGMMDQFVALLGRRDHALFLDARTLETDLVPIPTGYVLLLVDTGERHNNVRGHYNVRVAETRLAAALLSVPALRDAGLEAVASLPERIRLDQVPAGVLDNVPIPSVRELRVQARARHVVTENARVIATVAALKRGDMESVGLLLVQAHKSLSQDYEASCPAADALVEALIEVPGVLGARLTGAGWGGYVLALVTEDSLDGVLTRFPDAILCRSGDGAGPL